MTRAASSYSARSSWVYGALRGVILVVVGGKWAQVLCTPPDRKVVGAGPVGSGHGSYHLVSWWGGQSWCPPMAHAQWWQSGSAIRDVATSFRMAVRTSVLPHVRRAVPCWLATPRRRDVAATTEHGPGGGTNTGHPTMILTGMTHAHYQPALHPPPSDLGEF